MTSTLTSSDFIVKFHSITGTTIGERRKNLFSLLNQASTNKLTIDFKQIQPRTSLEESFKLEVLIYYNNIEALFSALTSENPALIHQIVKKASPNLIAALCNATEDQFLNVLSNISLNAKLKLLNKCGLHFDNSVKAERLFEVIKNKYGIYLATKLLTACSLEFIEDFVERNHFKLTCRQFLFIAKKYPDTVTKFLALLQKRFSVINEYKNVFKYISRNNVPLFLNLCKVYNLNTLNLGWHTTNNLIKKDKDNVINNAKIYTQLLRVKYIKRNLKGEDFNLFYYGLFPPLITQLESSYEQILTLTPNLDVLLSGFRRTYNIELWNEPKFVTPKVLEMMTNDARLTMLKPEYKPADFTDDDWACYLNTADAIPLLKKRIFLTSEIKSRARLIYLLVETCRINKDKAALLDICNYMIKQHRNDHISVRLSFLKGVRKGFKLQGLDMAHWSLINELIQIFQLNGEDFFHIEDFMIGYIECCLKNKQPIKEALVSFLKRKSYWGGWNILREKPALEKLCLQAIPSLLPDLGSDLVNNSVAYLNALVDWNKRHRKDTLPLFDNPSFVECLKEALQQQSRAFTNWDIIKFYILHTKTITEQVVFLELSVSYMDLRQINWLFHKRITLLLQSLEACINTALKFWQKTTALWRFSRLYTHLDLPQKVTDRCLHMLSQELPQDGKLIKRNALTALSCLLPCSDLVKLKYNIGPYMKNTVPNLYLTETVLTYCSTNRLLSVRRAMFSLMNNVTEPNLKKFMLQLMQAKNVNVRKIALYILFRTMDKETTMRVLKEFYGDSNNTILNKFILATVFKYFVKNPNEYVWNIIQLSISALDHEDKEGYELLLQSSKVPSEYLARYILFVWGVLENLPNFQKVYAVKLLGVAHPSLLPQDFCETVIDKYFFQYDRSYAEFYVALQTFVCEYICSNSSRLDYVDKVIKAAHTTDLKTRPYINHFVRQMCYECIKQNNKIVLINFATHWNNAIKPYEMFQEYLHIHLSLIQIENLPVLEIASRLASLCSSITAQYGIEFLHLYSQEIKSFLETHCFKYVDEEEKEANWLILVENVVKHDNVVALMLLGILLLEGHRPNLIETKKKYDELIRIFEERPEFEVCLYLNDLQNT